MYECCEWHAVGLNDTEITKQGAQYVSYCPECNSVSVYKDGVVKKVEGDEKQLYINKYQDKINQVINK